jgi:hypothetical protein
MWHNRRKEKNKVKITAVHKLKSYLVDVVRCLVATSKVEKSSAHRLTLLLLPGTLL